MLNPNDRFVASRPRQRTRSRWQRHTCLFAFLSLSTPGSEAATLRDARVVVALSENACDVTSRFVIDTADPVRVEHRLLLPESAPVPAFVVLGAIAGPADRVGRTAKLMVSLAGAGRNEYTVRYQQAAPRDRIDRCALLVPSAPTDGLSRAIRIEVALPAAARRLGGEFPNLSWSGSHGRVALGHLPSFVRVPYVESDAELTWHDRIDIRRAVDVTALSTVALATAAWILLRKRT